MLQPPWTVVGRLQEDNQRLEREVSNKERRIRQLEEELSRVKGVRNQLEEENRLLKEAKHNE